MIKLERNDGRMVRCVWNVSPGDRICAEELRTRMKLSSMKECSQDGKLQWFDHLGRMELSAWST